MANGVWAVVDRDLCLQLVGLPGWKGYVFLHDWEHFGEGLFASRREAVSVGKEVGLCNRPILEQLQ